MNPPVLLSIRARGRWYDSLLQAICPGTDSPIWDNPNGNELIYFEFSFSKASINATNFSTPSIGMAL